MNVNRIAPHLRIIIAEDDPDDLFLLQHALQQISPSSVTVALRDGVQLLTHLRSCTPMQMPDLIFIDLNMPCMDGREALRLLQEDPVLREIPVAIMTTSQEPEDRERLKSLKAAAWLTKPDAFSTLLADLQEVLERACPSGLTD